MAGLVPSNLSDIIAVANPEVQPKRRVVKARVVTDEEYYAILKSKERKEQEDKEAKEKRRLEREKKKEERERLKEAKGREREKKKQEKEAQKEAKKQEKEAQKEAKKQEKEAQKEAKKQKKPCRQKRKRSPVPSSDSDEELESNPGPSRQQPKHSRRFPARFRTADDSSDSSGNESDTVCGKCNRREPGECNDKHVFWIDCEVCDKWFFTFYVFSKKIIPRIAMSVKTVFESFN